MATGYYLLDHQLVRSQYRCPRRESPSGVIVIHSAENLPDVNPPDTGAEAVAKFIANRTDPGSYHRMCDSDSTVPLIPWDCEAFHDGTGTNPHSVGISGAYRAAQWSTLPKTWRDGCIRQMAAAAADYAAWLGTKRGIVIPARRISAPQARAGIPGFVTHAELDPTRRTDPGAAFPHNQFLAEYATLVAPHPIPDPVPHTEEASLYRIDPVEGPEGQCVIATPFPTTIVLGCNDWGIKGAVPGDGAVIRAYWNKDGAWAPVFSNLAEPGAVFVSGSDGLSFTTGADIRSVVLSWLRSPLPVHVAVYRAA